MNKMRIEIDDSQLINTIFEKVVERPEFERVKEELLYKLNNATI